MSSNRNNRYNNDRREMTSDRNNNSRDNRQYNDNDRNYDRSNYRNDHRGYRNDNRDARDSRRRYNNRYSNDNDSGAQEADDNQGYNIEDRIKQSNEQQENMQAAVKQMSISAEDLARREEYSAEITEFDNLSDLIDLKIIRGVMSYGFERPSPIQQKAIKPLLGGYDVIAQAQSGTGKTATFCIGTLGNINMESNTTQAIVLAHTLELAQQIQMVFQQIGKYLDVNIGLAIRSIPVKENIDQLTGANGGKIPQVVVGTPGRVLDMITKKVINNRAIKMLILDEADELLSDGFIMQIKDIIGNINNNVQIGLFSATMEPQFFKITQNFMRNPLNILIKKEELTLKGIKQYYIDCEKNEYKFETLCDLYSLIQVSQAIIYCNYYQSVEHLMKKLQEQNFKVSCIHGNMTVQERDDAMRNFRNMGSRVLISTDLLGRGIDVQQVSIVINYDTPLKIESYIHRIGRSGRHGRKGTAINFATGGDFKRLMDIEKYYQTKIEPLPLDVEKVFNDND